LYLEYIEYCYGGKIPLGGRSLVGIAPVAHVEKERGGH
jgi:hypothetical protein